MIYLLQNRSSDKDLETLYDKTDKYKVAVGKIVQKLLTKKYSKGIQHLSLDKLLEWKFWPISITIYSKLFHAFSV